MFSRPSLREAVGALLAFGLASVGADLLLLRHHESAPQLAPLAAALLALFALGWHRVRPGRRSIRLLQGAMLVVTLTGVVGLVLHNRGSAEFQRELDPSQSGLSLVWKAMQVKTPPALAPGILIQLGLLGLAYASRRPARPV